MKQLIKILIVSVIGLAACACQDNSDNTAFTPKTPELSFVESGIQAEKASGEYKVTIKSNLPWRIECNQSWVSFSPASGLGNDTVTVTVAANRTLLERQATISAYVIRGENTNLIVTQAPSTATDLATDYYVKVDGSADADGLSWEKATTLAGAIDKAMNGDIIHVAAGSYVPSVPLTGMTSSLDNTFEMHSNFSLIGGYPANATTGAVADPEKNVTILDGNHAVCHVVCVTATKSAGLKATLNGFTIKNGSSQFGTVSSTTINGTKIYQSYGAGLYIGNSTVDVLNCKIIENTDIRIASVRVDAGAEALFNNCLIADNATLTTTVYNCGGLWADGCTLCTINNCTFSNNKASGVAPCVYVYGSTSTTNVLITNSTISGNSVNPTSATRNGGGIYVREHGNLVIANSTIYGNSAGKGAGIAVYGSASAGSKATIISCTITQNSNATASSGPGIQQVNAYGAVELYNSIVAGNKTGTTDENVLWSTGNYKIVSSIIGTTVYNADGAAVSGAAFDVSTMLASLANNGGATKSCLLMGDSNPARQYGMTSSELQILGEGLTPALSSSLSTVDQTGTSRVGKTVIGAVVK